LGSALAADESLSVYELLQPLARFSLLRVDRTERTYSVHRLVQEVTKGQLSEESRRTWAERAVRGVNAAFPRVEFTTWANCERLAPQALAASELIATYGLQSNVSARLLNQVASHLEARGQYAVAEPLYQQALEVRRQVLGEQHPDFAPSLGNLAGLYSETGRSEQAEPLCQQALEVLRQVLGPNHPHTKLVQANYDRARRAR
jgi:tetratricopeptide (TPR) repeat protein